MACNTAGLGVMDLNGGLWSQLFFLHVEEIHVMSASMDDGENE